MVSVLFKFCGLSIIYGTVAASGLFEHGWVPVDGHDEHAAETHGHVAEWAGDHRNEHGHEHDRHHSHHGKHGFAEGDQSDWARLDYGGHKAQESADAWESDYHRESGSNHGQQSGFEHGEVHAHEGHGNYVYEDGHHGHDEGHHHGHRHHGDAGGLVYQTAPIQESIHQQGY